MAIEGAIAAVDPAASPPSLQVALANGKVLTFSTGGATSIVKNEAAAKLDDLKVGERVKVRFTMHEGGHVAKNLDVTGSPSSSSPSSDSSTRTPASTPQTP